MYPRLLKQPHKSFFLFGPRGTGKSTWVRQTFAGCPYLDLLDSEIYLDLLSSPKRLRSHLPKGHEGWVVIDEIQKVPALLDEIHRLLESESLRFAMTGSSARKLRARGVNLLAGRALTKALHPLLASELGESFDLDTALRFGTLPTVFRDEDPSAYLKSYVQTYLREEVQQEGLTRNLAAFSRFLESASFSQGSTLNVSSLAQECRIDRKMAESYFQILEDLLIGFRLPVFRKRSSRKLLAHPKFYFFDAGVYQAIRPKGPLDAPSEIEGPALETLVLSQLQALNDSQDLGYEIFYWRTRSGQEVDFVLYGERGLKAFEVKRTKRLRGKDFKGLRTFLADYPMAEARMLYCGDSVGSEDGIEVLPVSDALLTLEGLL